MHEGRDCVSSGRGYVIRKSDKALGSSFARGHCSVSTEAMASVAFNMSARAAVGGAQLKLSAQRKRGACPASSLHRPSPGAPRTRNLAEGLGLFPTAGFHAMPSTGANAAATSTRPARGALGRIHRLHVTHHARAVDGSSEASRRARASRRESRRPISRLYPLPPEAFIQSRGPDADPSLLFPLRLSTQSLALPSAWTRSPRRCPRLASTAPPRAPPRST